MVGQPLAARLAVPLLLNGRGIVPHDSTLHLRHDPLQTYLACNKRELAEIAAIEFEEVEGKEERPFAAEQEFVKPAAPIVVEADDLSIENRRLAANGVGEFDLQHRPVLEGVAPP